MDVYIFIYIYIYIYADASLAEPSQTTTSFVSHGNSCSKHTRPILRKIPPKSVPISSSMVTFVRFARAVRPAFSKTELSRDVFCARGRFAYTKHYLVTPILNLNETREIRSPAPPHGAPFLCQGALAPA